MDVIGYVEVRRKQFQLCALALFVKDLYRLQPPGMRRPIQLPQITKRALPRPICSTHGLNQRPIAVLFAVSKALVLAKKHLAPIMAAENFGAQEGWSALHQVFHSAATETKPLRAQK
jgi:hypothetical protein